VTGSTSGIGLALCPRLCRAARQHRSHGRGRRPNIEKERSSIEADFKSRAVHSARDMTSPMRGGRRHALRWVKRFARSTFLVNMPAFSSCRRVEEFPIDKWDAIIAINLSSAFHGIRGVVPGMKKRGWAASQYGVGTFVGGLAVQSAYVSAKHGINGNKKTPASPTDVGVELSGP